MKYIEVRKVLPDETFVDLPNYISLTFDSVWNPSPSVIDIEYPFAAAPFGVGSMLAVLPDGVEIPDRYVVEKLTNVTITESGIVGRWSGRSLKALLEDDFVWPSAWPNPVPQGHAFIDSTAGTILKTFLTRSNDRGILTLMSHASFTGTTDSSGQPWGVILDRNFANGTTLLQVAQNLFEAGILELRTVGFAFQAYKSGGLQRHLPITDMSFNASDNIADESQEVDATQFYTDVLMEGEQAAASHTEPDAYTVLGRRRARYATAGGVADPGTLSMLAQTDLAAYTHLLTERGLGVTHQLGEPQPFVDYRPGDWAWFDINGTLVELQIQQIAINVRQGQVPTVGLTVGDLLDASDVVLKRRLDAITGGGAGGSGPIPGTTGNVNLAPAAPSAPTATFGSYIDDKGVNRVAGIFQWNEVTTNADGTPANDLQSYELYMRDDSPTAEWQLIGKTAHPAHVASYSPLPENTYKRFIVYAIDSSGLRSAASAEARLLTTTDTTPPPIPSTPTIAINLGVVSVGWDGLNSGGTAMTLTKDFSHIVVYRSLTNNFTSGTQIDTLRGAGSISVSNQAYGVPWYYKFASVDTSGNISALSAQASATVQPLVTGDLAQSVIDGILGTAEGYDAARATDLITNGTAFLGTNYNFSNFILHKEDAPAGTTGSFYANSTTFADWSVDQMIPYDPAKKYRLSMQLRQTVAGATNRAYGYIAPIDSSNLVIDPFHYVYITGTQTTLAATLNPGATTITLTSSANWFGSAGNPAGALAHRRTIQFWNYVDPNGKAWGTYTYTRNVLLDAWADGGISGNVITLRNPYDGPSMPAGTAVSNGTSGNSLVYMPTLFDVVIPTTWTTYSEIHAYGVASTAKAVTGEGSYVWTEGFPPGTAKLRIGWLLNGPPSPSNPTVGRHAVAAVSFSDAAAAQYTADIALTSANGKNKVTYSASTPGATANIAGDIWFQQVSNQIIGQWVGLGGTSWQSVTLRNEVIATLDAGKITSGFIDVARLLAGSIGASKLAVGDTANYAQINESQPGVIANHTTVNNSGTMYSTRVDNTQLYIFRQMQGPIPFRAGDRIRLNFTGYSLTGTPSALPRIRYNDGTTSWTLSPVAGSPTNFSGVPQTFSYEGDVPDTIGTNTQFTIGLDATHSGVDIRLRSVRAYRMSAGELLVDGSVSALKIAANSITADKVVAGAITADKLSLGIIRSNLIADPSFEEDYTLTTFGVAGHNVNQWRKFDASDTGDIVERATNGASRGGAKSLRMKCDGFGVTSVVSNTFPIVNGQLYRVQFSAIASGSGPILTFSVLSGDSQSNVDDFFNPISTINDNDPPYTITNKVLTSNVGTLTTAVEHDYIVGDSIFTTGVGAPFDGWWTVSAVPSPTEFSFNVTNANIASQAASGTVVKNLKPNVVTLPAGSDLFSTYSYTFVGTAKPWAAVRFNNLFGGGNSIWVDDVSVVPVGTGGASELTAAGLRLFNDEGLEIGAFVSNRPSYFTITGNDGVLASINAEGEGTFSGLSSTAEPIFGGLPLFGSDVYFDTPAEDYAWQGILDQKPRGLISRGYRTGSSATTASGTEQKFLELQTDVNGNRFHAIGMHGVGVANATDGANVLLRLRYLYAGIRPVINKALTSNVATLTTSEDHGFIVGDVIEVEIGDSVFDGRFTVASVPTTTTVTYSKTNANVTSQATEGDVTKAVTTSSTVAAFVRVNCPQNGVLFSAPDRIAQVFGSSSGNPAAKFRLKVLLTWTPEGGSGAIFNATGSNAEIRVEDKGPFFNENNGIEWAADVTPTTPPSTPVKKTYTSVWRASLSEAYGYMSGSSYAARTDVSDLYQGYFSSNQNNQHSIVIFDNGAISGEAGKKIGTALSGATIKKVEVYLHNKTWYGSSGAVLIRPYTSTSLTTSPASVSSDYRYVSAWPEGQGKWVDITSLSGVGTNIKGFRIGRGQASGSLSTSKTFYGTFAGHSDAYTSKRPLIRVTYIR